jgi:hypothetical protein
VDPQIRLAVAIEIQRSDANRACNGFFEDAAFDDAVAGTKWAGQADVY